MDFDITPQHREFQRRVREFCDQEVCPRAKDNDAKETFPWDLIPGLRRLGLLGIIFPKDYGGQGLDMLAACLALEELGRADAALALTVESHNGLCTNHIFMHGNEAQKRRYVPRLASGEVLGAWALTEPEAGSDAASLKTRASFDGKLWTINGSKTFTTQGSVAGVYVVFAQTLSADNGGGRDGLTAFVMEKATPGLNIGKIEHKMGLRSSDTAQLHLHNVRLGPESVIGEPGRAFRDAMKILDGGRVAISGISVGIARASLEYGLERVRARPGEYGIGQPGLTYAQRVLGQLAADIESARMLMFKAAWLHDTKQPFSMEASMAKLVSGELAVRAPTEILDLIGPEGASLDCPVQRYFRDSKLYTIGEGSTQIQQLVISRHLLGRAPSIPKTKEPSHA